MTEYEFYHNALEQSLLSGEALRLRLCRQMEDEALPGGEPRQQTALRRRHIGRFLLYTAAALLVCLGAAMAVPPARAAILRILTPAVEPAEYLATPEAERETLPAMDAAIGRIEEQSLTVSVAQAADENWRAWAERLSVQLDQLLYDGETLYLNGVLRGNTADFVKPEEACRKVETAEGLSLLPPDDLVIGDCRFSVGAGAAQRTLASIFLLPWHDVQNEALASTGALPISLALPVGAGLTGEQTLTLEFLFSELAPVQEVGDGQFSPQATLRIEGLRFDATAGTAAISALSVPAPATLVGEALVFSGAESVQGEGAEIGNDRLSLEGGSLSILAIRQKLGGTELTLRIALPEGWTQAQRDSFARYVSVEFVIDGENMGGFGTAYSRMHFYGSDAQEQLERRLPAQPPACDLARDIIFTVETALQPTDWAQMQSFALLLRHDVMRRCNGVAVPEDGRAAVACYPQGWEEDTEPARYTDCMLYVLGG